jgi:hypothetical protein
MTKAGVTIRTGTIFKMTTAGVYTVIRAFIIILMGAAHTVILLLGKDGKLLRNNEEGRVLMVTAIF